MVTYFNLYYCFCLHKGAVFVKATMMFSPVDMPCTYRL